MMHRGICSWLTAVISTIGCVVTAASAPGQPPFLRVTRDRLHEKVYRMDASVSDPEWKGACGLVGMVNAPAGLVSESSGLDVRWRINYDDQRLYFMAVCIQPKSAAFIATAVANDDPAILKDDHVVIQFSFNPRERAGTQKYFMLAVNPKGALYDIIRNAEPGQDRLDWSSGAEVKCSFMNYWADSIRWITEISIPLKQIDTPSLEGKRMLLQLARCSAGGRDGFSYISWAPAGLTEWDRFGEVLFEATAPVYLGGWLGNVNIGNLHYKSTVFNKGHNGKQEYCVDLTVTSGGTELLTNTLKKILLPGEGFEFDAGRAAFKPREDNLLALRVYENRPGAPYELYSVSLPFKGYARSDFNKKMELWRSSRKIAFPAHATYRHAFYPYYNKLETWVDTRIDRALSDDPQKADKIIAAKSMCVRLVDKDGTVYGQAAADLSEQKGRVLAELTQPLPAGRYTLVIELQNGDETVDVEKREIVRDRFPWEHNTIGKEKVIIPPWIPVTTDGTRIGVWGREYDLGENGLPVSIKAEGREILAGPMTLIADIKGEKKVLTPVTRTQVVRVKGQKVPAEFERYQFQGSCPKARLEDTDGYAATVSAEGTIGDLTCEIAGTMEYDGWYRVKLRLTPPSSGAKVNSLDLVIPFDSAANLMRFERGEIYKQATIPKGSGILWESTSLPMVANCRNSFIPAAYIGNYSRGLWWYAESDKGWVTSDKESLVRLERDDGGKLLLRLRLVNTPAEIRSPREIVFAVLASPTKPRFANHRALQWESDATTGKGMMTSNGLCANHWTGNYVIGTGWPTFTLYTDEDYEGLRYALHDMKLGPRDRGICKNGEPSDYPMRWALPAREDRPVKLYGSISCVGTGCREFPTFRGEWGLGVGDNDAVLKDSATMYGLQKKGKKNLGGTRIWDIDDKLGQFWSTGGESYRDFFIWHITQAAEKSGFNGTYNDNFEHFIRFPVDTDATGDAYRRDDGTLQGLAGVFRRRDLLRRISTALWLCGRPPFNCMNVSEPQPSFTQMGYAIEGRSYTANPNHDYIDTGFTPDAFQALTVRPESPVVISPNFPPYESDRTYNRTAERLVLGYCLLFDRGMRITYFSLKKDVQQMLDRLQTEVGFFDGARLVPCWEDGGWHSPLPEKMLLGGYVHPQGKRAVLILLNGDEKDVETTFSIEGQKILSCNIADVQDLESGERIPCEDGRLTVKIGRHQVRYFVAGNK